MEYNCEMIPKTRDENRYVLKNKGDTPSSSSASIPA